MQTILVTHKLIEQGKSAKGGWTSRQLDLLGVSWPPVKGWKKRLHMTIMPKATIDKFIALSDNKRVKKRT